LIGLIGVGGVIIVPALVIFVDLTPQQAVVVAMASFLTSGAIGATPLVRNKTRVGRDDVHLLMCAFVGAICGAVAITMSPQVFASLMISAIIISACGMAYFRKLGGEAKTPSRESGNFITGFGVGFGSAMSGTGGPVLLAPLLLRRGVEPRRVIALSQAIQLPIAGSATATNILFGNIDWNQVLVLSAGLALGMMVVTGLSAGMSSSALRSIILLVAIAAAISLALQALFQIFNFS